MIRKRIVIYSALYHENFAKCALSLKENDQTTFINLILDLAEKRQVVVSVVRRFLAILTIIDKKEHCNI
jgi:hypothetical protein